MSADEVFQLRERAKELRCLYRVHEAVSQRGQPPAHVFLRVLEVIPDGWQRPDSTGARIEYMGRSFVGPGFSSSGRSITEPILLCGIEVGWIQVSDTIDPQLAPEAFLPEESVLLRNIAHRISEYLEWKHTELLGGRATEPGLHWRWRESYARSLANALDADRFGVTAVYLGGSTGNGEAGPGSDIDLFIVTHGTDAQRHQLSLWLEGWSLCLGELSLQQTGYGFQHGMLNVQWLDAPPNIARRPDLHALPLGMG